MNTIDVREKCRVNDKLYYDIIIDKEKTLCMEVSIDNNIATISYDGNMKAFNGFFGALLLKDLLNYVLFNIENVTEVKTYFDSNNMSLSRYGNQFKYQTDILNDEMVCCFVKK